MNKKMELTGFEIAIIGMDGRFPAAQNVDEFWQNLKNGVEAIAFFSDEELAAAGVYPELLNNPDYVKANGYLEDIEYFDSSFFDYTPGEAAIMDPQMRIFHECVWKALEDAGYCPDTYNGLIGVYGGANPNFNWEALVAISGKSDHIGLWSATQLVDKDYLCTRVSYKLNLKGPSFSMDTACSTSLVAIHLACQAILNGECDMALAGGVSTISADKAGYLYQEGMIYSPDGHTRAFDASARGVVSGNGAAIVVLKRLEDALADRDHIYAVIKGSAINNDGLQKTGYTAPSVEGQARVIQAAQLMAEVEPEAIGYIETHGTGTELGDPVEIEGLKLAFNPDKNIKKNQKFCPIGSVKTNIGHLDAAAGAAGLIKTALAIKNRLIPPSLHFQRPNPKSGLENSPFYVISEPTPWENEIYPLRAGVSSFGIGGTNAHVILEEAPQPELSSKSREFQLLLLSAKTETALERITRNLAVHLQENPEINLADVAFTLQTGRKGFHYRRMVVWSMNEPEQVIRYLSSPQQGSLQMHTGLVTEKNRPLVFMFSGQGSQYVNMGRDLYRDEPLFREEVDRCFRILESLTDVNFKDILYPGMGAGDDNTNDKEYLESAKKKIDDVLYSGPIKLLFEYSLAKLLMRWGIKPHAMIGHSLGEYTAAALAGVFSLENALKLAVFRGRLMRQTPRGAMISVQLPEEQLKSLLGSDLSIAAVNAPALCAVAGPPHAVNRLEKKLKTMKHECLRFNVSVGFHSRMMAPILEEFTAEAGKISFNKPKIPYISGLTGNWITYEQAASPIYWARHMAETIRFADGIGKLITEINPIFVQVGSDRGLPLNVKLHPLKKEENFAINIIRHPREKEPDVFFLLSKIGRLWISGADIDWSGFYEKEKRNRIPLPTYPFERTSYPARGNFFQMLSQLLSKLSTISQEKDDNLQSLVRYINDLRDPPDPRESSAAARENEKKSSTPSKQVRPKLSSQYAAPRDETEQTIVEIFQQFFGIEPVGIYDDFYELGGDSLRAVQLAELMKKANIHITLQQLLLYQNIHDICKNLRQKEKASIVLDPELIEHFLSEKYNNQVYYRTYQSGGITDRILFIAHDPFNRRRVLEDIANGIEGSTDAGNYPNFIIFTEPGSPIPPTSGKIADESLSKILGLREQISEEEFCSLLEELNKNSKFTQCLKKNTKIGEYELSPIQKAWMQPPYDIIASTLIPHSYDFCYPTDIAKIREITAALINSNCLLRSVIAHVNGNCFLEEFDSFADIRTQLPVIDISAYSPSCRGEIVNRIVQHLMEPLDVLDNVLFRLVVVKPDHTHYTLIFIFNHLIFDAISADVLDKQLNQLTHGIHDLQPLKKPTTDYRDYVKFLQNLDYENIQLEKYLNFHQYLRSIKKSFRKYSVKKLKHEAFEVDISNIGETFKGYYNEIFLLIYARVIAHLFGVKKVPIAYIFNGRNYKDGNFDHIIGDFHDNIPVLFSLDEPGEPKGMIDRFIDYKRFIRENNLNFCNYLNRGYITGVHHEKLVSPFSFNSIIGSYDSSKKLINQLQERRTKRLKVSSPVFAMNMVADFYTDKLWVSFLQNSKFALKEIFMKNYLDLVQYLKTGGQFENNTNFNNDSAHFNRFLTLPGNSGNT